MGNEVDIFVHGDGRQPSLVNAEQDDSLKNVLSRVGIESLDEIEISPEGDFNDDDNEVKTFDANIEADLQSQGIKSGSHIFCYRCKSVGVRINYQCETANRKFPARTRIRRIIFWAFREFDLDHKDAAQFFLKICDEQKGARPNQHLGEFAIFPDCEVCFDLVPDPKIQG